MYMYVDCVAKVMDAVLKVKNEAHKFIELFDSLKSNNPFCEKNVKILKNTLKSKKRSIL